MYEYCFRAQFRADVLVVMRHIPDAVYSIQDLDEKLPDVEVVMSCRHNFDSPPADLRVHSRYRMHSQDRCTEKGP